MAEQTIDCPPLSLADMLALLALQNQGGQQPGTQQPGTQQPGTLPRIAPVIATGQLLEQTDNFRFRAYSSQVNVPVTFYGRILRPSGVITPFAHVLNTVTAGTTYTTEPQAGEGYLLGAAASVPIDSITGGFVTAVGEVGRGEGSGFVPHTLLFSGQLDDLTPLTSIVPTPQIPTIRAEFYALNDVAGGAVPYSQVITPNPGKRFRFTRVAFDYACSATVGTRFPRLLFRIGGNSFQTVFFPLTRTAGQTGTYDCSISGAAGTVSPQSAQPINSTLYFYDPVTVVIENGTLIVNDTVTNVFIRWEES